MQFKRLKHYIFEKNGFIKVTCEFLVYIAKKNNKLKTFFQKITCHIFTYVLYTNLGNYFLF